MDSEHMTSGQVAKACGVTSRTVTQWMAKGLLKGWRIPGSEDRRFLRSNVIAFCIQHQMPFLAGGSDVLTLLNDCEKYLKLLVPSDTVGKELLERFEQRRAA